MIKTEWRQSTRRLAQDAWWYATGRNDHEAEIDRLLHAHGEGYIDADAFAQHYGSMDHDVINEVVSFRPSIQDAYAAWREQHP